MIEVIKGIILEKRPPDLVIDVNGIGYALTASMNTFYQLPEVGQSVSIRTHFIVREDAQLLYGFIDERERVLFRDLIKVNGVGAKMAITLLSSIDVDGFVYCIRTNDSESLIRLPGIGKKTAARLIVEMRDRLQNWKHNINITTTKNTIAIEEQLAQDAVSALIALGYKSTEATRAIKQVTVEGASSEELIRLGLKQLSKT